MKHIVLFFTLSFTLISVVRSEEDLTCKAGYGASSGKIFTSGYASQCSGVSKITTEAECELAAEYNRKNNIDKNWGYGGRMSYPTVPPGCIYNSRGDYKYYWNDNKKSTRKCSTSYKCICKTKTCINCPINTYSEGGINPTCTPCPKERAYTKQNHKQDSIDSCTDELHCEPGYEVVAQADYRTSGLASQCSGIFKIETKEECEAVAKDNNKYYVGRYSNQHHPFGCFHSKYDNKYWFNDNPNSKSSSSFISSSKNEFFSKFFSGNSSINLEAILSIQSP